MVESLIKHISCKIKDIMGVDESHGLVYRTESGIICYGDGQEYKNVSITDNNSGIYIRQLQPENFSEPKQISSCDVQYNISVRNRLVFYSFTNNKTLDKVKSALIIALTSIVFDDYEGKEYEIYIVVNSIAADYERIYKEETGKKYEGNVFPMLIALEFTLSFVDLNCDICG